ncbi:MAG: hypothetical protein RI977_360 [Bacteroidota bacterium]
MHTQIHPRIRNGRSQIHQRQTPPSADFSQAGLTRAKPGLKILELMLSAKPNDATVNRIGNQHFTPNFRQKSQTNTAYSGINAHLLLRKIIIGSNEGEAQRWLINTNKSRSKKSKTNNMHSEDQLFLEITTMRGDVFASNAPNRSSPNTSTTSNPACLCKPNNLSQSKIRTCS